MKHNVLMEATRKMSNSKRIREYLKKAVPAIADGELDTLELDSWADDALKLVLANHGINPDGIEVVGRGVEKFLQATQAIHVRPRNNSGSAAGSGENKFLAALRLRCDSFLTRMKPYWGRLMVVGVVVALLAGVFVGNYTRGASSASPAAKPLLGATGDDTTTDKVVVAQPTSEIDARLSAIEASLAEIKLAVTPTDADGRPLLYESKEPVRLADIVVTIDEIKDSALTKEDLAPLAKEESLRKLVARTQFRRLERKLDAHRTATETTDDESEAAGGGDPLPDPFANVPATSPDQATKEPAMEPAPTDAAATPPAPGKVRVKLRKVQM